MEKANQIQIGMLGVIIVLLLAQMSGVFGGGTSSSNDVRANARQSLNTTNPAPVTPAANTPAANTPAVPSGPTTSIAFAENTFDFGTVNEGEKVEHVFTFTNSGQEPLTITNAKGSCGCTVPDWPKEPIPPGKGSEIKVVFDSKGKAGKRDPKVTITANTNPVQTVINMVGEVIKDPNSPTATTPTTPVINPQ
ncbi:MAG: DUF1573 domain-containing protein [Bacteroidota bacterium]